MAKYTATAETKSATMGNAVVYEVAAEYSRDQIFITTSSDLPVGTILENTSGTWAVASAGTGPLGILAGGIAGSSSAQNAVIVARGAVVVSGALVVDSSIKSTAFATLGSQGIKIA